MRSINLHPRQPLADLGRSNAGGCSRFHKGIGHDCQNERDEVPCSRVSEPSRHDPRRVPIVLHERAAIDFRGQSVLGRLGADGARRAAEDDPRIAVLDDAGLRGRHGSEAAATAKEGGDGKVSRCHATTHAGACRVGSTPAGVTVIDPAGPNRSRPKRAGRRVDSPDGSRVSGHDAAGPHG